MLSEHLIEKNFSVLIATLIMYDSCYIKGLGLIIYITKALCASNLSPSISRGEPRHLFFRNEWLIELFLEELKKRIKRYWVMITI
jgi:hypothetical protein